MTGARAFPVLGDLEGSGCAVDAYWADDARIDERAGIQCSTAVIPGTAEQDQCNRKTMDHFAGFDPARCFPEIPERP